VAAKKRRGLTALATEKEMANDPDEAIAILEARRERESAVEAPPKPKKQANRKKLTLDIPADLIREIRVACLELPPKLTGGGPSGFVARAAEAYLEELRAQHNGGFRFESEDDPRIPKGPKK
jgi:hypothetical protein